MSWLPSPAFRRTMTRPLCH